MFSCKSFIVFCLTFRSLIHFQFIFVYDVGECSNFILLHVVFQLIQHHLLKRHIKNLQTVNAGEGVE